MKEPQYFYCRVSSKGQDYEGQVEAARAMGIPEENIFKEKMTGTSKERPEYRRLLATVKETGGTIWVRDLTRWGRSLQDTSNSVAYLREIGATLKTLDGKVDTSDQTTMGKAFLHLLMMFAELERDFIVDRFEAGRLRAKANRDYREGRKPKFTEAQVEELQQRYMGGWLPTELAREYEVSVSTVRRALGLNKEASTYGKRVAA